MAKLHHEVVLDLQPDSVEWCPNLGLHNGFAVGSYQLNEATGARSGKLYWYEANPEVVGGMWQLQPGPESACSGIFDMRWAPPISQQPALLALALADGMLKLVAPPEGGNHSKERQGAGSSLDLSCSVEAAGSSEQFGWTDVASIDVASGMILTVDWGRHPSHQRIAVVSTSTGYLATVETAEAELCVSHVWHGHDLEAWVIAASHHQAGLLFSGSDDCKLKGWDLRAPTNMPSFVNSREHGSGVCCIQSSPTLEHLLVTGSYDEYVRMWDLRMMSRPSCTSKVSTGGGVWRLKWHPSDPLLLLASCMHNGFAVVSLSQDSTAATISVSEKYEHQKTLGYGGDWCHTATAEIPTLVATCSFYDRLLHLWEPSTRPVSYPAQ